MHAALYSVGGEGCRKNEGVLGIFSRVGRVYSSKISPPQHAVCLQARAPTAGRSLQALEVVVQVLAARGGACGAGMVGREGVSKFTGFVSNLRSFALVVP